MTGSTTKFAWPFPLPSEPIAQGATVIGQLAQAIENSIVLPDNANTADAFLGAYPNGLSTMLVTSPASAGNWPAPNSGGAMVLTYRGSGLGFQFYASGSTFPSGFLMRWIGASSANPWQPINAIIPVDTFAASEPSTSYPAGNTSMAISAANFAALGWPTGAGQVTTYRNSTGTIAYQFYMVTNTPQLLYRWFGATPSAWATLWDPSVPTASATGGISNATIVANTNNAIPVVYPAGRFTGSGPRVTATVISPNPQSWALSVTSTTASGFTAQIFHPTATTASIHWIATQGAT